MLTEDVIRKAVELAPGFLFDHGRVGIVGVGLGGHISEQLPQWFLDALAAALVRVVDASELYFMQERCHKEGRTRTWTSLITNWNGRHECRKSGSDRTENTINAIVEFSESHPEVFK